jgi:hypothetical protein
METGPDAVDTVENEFENAKHGKWDLTPSIQPKMCPGAQNMKMTPSVPQKMGPGSKYMKTRSDALGIAEHESGSAKLENGNPTPSVQPSIPLKLEKVTRRPRYRRKCVRQLKIRKRDATPSVRPKTGPGAQNMKMGPDALGTAENGSRRSKYENGTRRRRYRRKWVRESKTNLKTIPDALGTVENESGTRHPRYRRK